MVIEIHTKENIQPIAIWENYLTIPMVGDKIGGFTKALMVVNERIFYKDKIIIVVK